MKKNIFTLMLCTQFVFASNVLAETKTTSLGKLTHPAVQGTECVIKDTMEMRKNHMKYIMHRRSETARDGKRWKKDTHAENFSLEKCINCHARDEKGNAVKLKLDNGKLNPKHFCQTCHNYTAVSVDCFSCHSATPTGKVKTVSKNGNKK